jgi:hypothetical protein
MDLKQVPRIRVRLKTRTVLLVAVCGGASLLLFAIIFGYLNLDFKKEAVASADTSRPGVMNISKISFTATLDSNSDVLLRWPAEKEIAVKYYTVERSSDGINWTVMKNVQEQQAEQTTEYSWLDEEPVRGTGFYRLCTKAINGAITITGVDKIVYPENEPEKKRIVAGPNPFTNIINVTLDESTTGDATFRLFNTSGIMVYETVYHGSDRRTSLQIPADLPKGIYILKTFAGTDNYEALRLIKH